MKKLILSLILLIAGTAVAHAQQVQPPLAVTKAFQERFPNAKKVRWQQDNQTAWEVDFKWDKKCFTAEYDPDGTWLATEYEVKRSLLPQAVKDMIKRDFPGFKVDEVEWVETPEGAFYEIELEKREGKKEYEMELLVTPTGEVITKGELIEDDED